MRYLALVGVLGACSSAEDLALTLHPPGAGARRVLQTHAIVTLEGPEHVELAGQVQDPLTFTVERLLLGTYTMTFESFGSATPTDQCPAVDGRVSFGTASTTFEHDGSGSYEQVISVGDLACFPAGQVLVVLKRNGSPAPCKTLFPEASSVLLHVTDEPGPYTGTFAVPCVDNYLVKFSPPHVPLSVSAEITRSDGAVCARLAGTVDEDNRELTWSDPVRDIVACP